MEKFLYPNHPLRCIICGRISTGRSVDLTNSIFYFINDFEKVYTFSPRLHQELYQKLFE